MTAVNGPAALRAPAAPEEVGAATLLGVCASMKPAPGQQTSSAARSVLRLVLGQVAPAYPEVGMLDLREHPLPLFDGRMPEQRPEPAVRHVHGCVSRAGALLLSVPAYWTAVSGVFKNFVDVLCGPAYDLTEGATTVFAGKPIGVIVLGADGPSTRAGAAQAIEIIEAVGARLVGAPVAIANPREGGVDTARFADVLQVAAELTREAFLAARVRA